MKFFVSSGTGDQFLSQRHPGVGPTAMGFVQPSTVHQLAESLAVPNLSEDAAKALAPHIDVRLREIVQVIALVKLHDAIAFPPPEHEAMPLNREVLPAQISVVPTRNSDQILSASCRRRASSLVTRNGSG